MISSFSHQVAQRILHAQGGRDLRVATVLLPNNYVAKPLAQAFGEVAGTTVLLPRMFTLTDWAQSISLATPVQPDTRRIAALYQALREREWFGDADLWSLSRELLGLMDELTRHHVALPESEADFAAQLTEAYRARSGQALQFEARVVHELWYAMTSDGELDSVRAYQLRLAQLAQQVDADGVHLGGEDGSIAAARQVLGFDKIIGVSCYNRLSLAQQAEGLGADYVAFGAFFASTVKPRARVAELPLLQEARRVIKLPVVAIGGITLENGASVLEAGADALAVISALFSAPDITLAARQFANLNTQSSV